MASHTKSRMPSFIPPMMAEPVEQLPRNMKDVRTWGYEPKIDGHRLQILKDGDVIRIRTRNDRQPLIDVQRIASQAATIAADQAIIDGEGAAVDETGRTSWSALERRDKTIPIVFFAFDLLYLNGRSLLPEPLRQRQALLAEVIEGSGLQLCVALPGTLAKITQLIRRMGLEGIVAKDQESEYLVDRRAFVWQKKRFNMQQEFVIGGYRPNGDQVDSLLVGVYEGSQLKFTSKVRAGLDRTNRGPIRRELQPFHIARCPFVDLPTSARRRKTSWDNGGVAADEMDEMQWVRPKLLAEVKFLHWTDIGRLRHPWFVRLRSDKPAKQVVRET